MLVFHIYSAIVYGCASPAWMAAADRIGDVLGWGMGWGMDWGMGGGMGWGMLVEIHPVLSTKH